ncbi:MAG: IclR family transcriptional regulator [Terricaulis sp.]
MSDSVNDGPPGGKGDADALALAGEPAPVFARRARELDLAKTVYKAPALDKGLEILELLAGQALPMAMPEIAQLLGRSKTEIYRMLVVLEARGYIERGQHDDRYQVTSRLFELGMRNAPKRNLHDAALPVMHDLANKTLQSCHLGVATGDQLVIVARVESPAALGFSVRVGYRVPILDSTSGRVIFGSQPAKRQTEWLKTLKASASDKQKLEAFSAEANAVAARGYAVEPSRLADGIRDIGAPVFDGESLGAVASLTVPFVAHRYLTASLEEVITHTVDAAKEITRRLEHG